MTPCTDRWSTYDTLADLRGGDEWNDALRTARALCATCPIWSQCLRDNRDERWAQAVITGRNPHAGRDAA